MKMIAVFFGNGIQYPNSLIGDLRADAIAWQNCYMFFN
jgi:hypothetical protein